MIAIVHWAWAKVPKWAVGWGWLENPWRGPRPEETVEIFRFLREQRRPGREIGEWAFYAAVILIALALIKRFPYRYFFQTHRLMAVGICCWCSTSVVLMNFGYWSQPVGPVMALLMAGGSGAAVVSCYARWGPPPGPRGDRGARPPPGQPGAEGGHPAAGPLARPRLSSPSSPSTDEGAHPFTISSAWQGDGRMFLLIKGIGDYTGQPPGTLRWASRSRWKAYTLRLCR